MNLLFLQFGNWQYPVNLPPPSKYRLDRADENMELLNPENLRIAIEILDFLKSGDFLLLFVLYLGYRAWRFRK